MKVSTNDLDVRVVRPSDVRAEINYAMNRKRPVFIWGSPGVGKSEIVDSITQERSGFMIDLRLALMEPTDLRGIPYFNEKNGTMEWATLSYWSASSWLGKSDGVAHSIQPVLSLK